MKDFKDIRIAVAGTGYVGLSIATLLSQHHHVTAVDVVPEKVEKINKGISPIQDEYIERLLAGNRLYRDIEAGQAQPSEGIKPVRLDLTAPLDGRQAYREADFVVIAAPTNYDPVKNFFDTHHI